MNLIPFFKKYEALVEAVDKIFEHVKTNYPRSVTCKIGCSECCYALFDVSLVEAMYINQKFYDKFADRNLEKFLENVNRIDRKIHKIKRAQFKKVKEGKSQDKVLEEFGKIRIPCPLLNEKQRCDLYEFRPITCRAYGIPTSIAGNGHICGLSEFKEGEKYPTVNLDIVFKQLRDISMELANSLQSKYSGIGEIIVPVSMAILTKYDSEYLGLERKDYKEKDK